MDASVSAVENIINYSFNNKTLLEEALTHSSYTQSPSYERLEFLGDSALGLAFSNFLFLAYPEAGEGDLTDLRSANVNTEKLARVALRHGFSRHIRHSAPQLDDQVNKFAEAVSREDGVVFHAGLVKAPDFLADIVESIAAAVYIDIDFDIRRFWVIFKDLLEPIVTIDDLKQEPQPVTQLFQICQKQGKQVDMAAEKNGAENIARVYVDGEFVTSATSEHKNIAKLEAAKAAIFELAKSMLPNIGMPEMPTSVMVESESAKQRLYLTCTQKKWPKPIFKIEKETGPHHEKKFQCSVQVDTRSGVFFETGDIKSRVRDSENSAASLMIQALKEYGYL